MKKLFFLFILFGTSLFGQNTVLFEEGNTAYNKGDFEMAVNRYEAILDKGETSAELYFNLANAYYKLEQVAPAIYNYEKALQLKPADGDILNNLSLTQNLVIDDIEEARPSGIAGLWNSLVSILSFNQLAWGSIILAFGFAILFCLYYFSKRSLLKRIFFTSALFCSFFTLIFLIFAFLQKSEITDNNFAIIFSQEAAVRDEPTLRSTESFFLHEGTKIEVLETYQNWIKLELANGIQGWMDKEDVKML